MGLKQIELPNIWKERQIITLVLVQIRDCRLIFLATQMLIGLKTEKIKKSNSGYIFNFSGAPIT